MPTEVSRALETTTGRPQARATASDGRTPPNGATFSTTTTPDPHGFIEVTGATAQYYEITSLDDLQSTLNLLQVILGGTALAASLAGAALGWDRLTALLTGVDSIREVIAFPKTGAGFDPLTGAPTPISDAQRDTILTQWDLDFAYQYGDKARFRANLFVDLKGMGAVMRVIPSKILTVEDPVPGLLLDDDPYALASGADALVVVGAGIAHTEKR